MEMVQKNKFQCTGCGVCRYKCPKDAITMSRDDEGFLYPFIDTKQCIKCNLCREICPNHNVVNEYESKVYAVKNKNDDIRKKSTSGGLFTVLSNSFIKNLDVVCGCVLDEELNPVHIVTNVPEQRDSMRDSKYVQSDIHDIFPVIEPFLNAGKKVLFTGTPCQTAAVLKAFENHKNISCLYTCDIVCHGVPSPQIFKEHVAYLEKKHHSKILGAKFRAKELGWGKSNKRMIKFYTDKGVLYDELFYKLYFNFNIISRPSCEHCQFASLHRNSDFTIGDFWGIEKFYPDFYDELGVSLMLVNTEKGERLMNEIKDELNIKVSTKEYCVKENPRLETPPIFDKRRAKLFDDYKKHGYPYIVKNYITPSIFTRIKKKFITKLKGVH